MADMLATAEDLAKLVDDSGLDEDRATLLLELSTAQVQAAAGQRLVRVEDDPFEMFGFTDSWLELKEGPVEEISSLTLDGDPLEVGVDFKWVAGSRRLYRRSGWARCWWEPSTVAGVTTHGYASDDQRIQFARSATLGISRLALDAPTGPVVAESIDDYRVQYAAAVAWAMEQSPHLENALARIYGQRAGLVRLG